MSEDKHAAFQRLSEKRLETVEDAIRIWSNLSGPSYEFTTAEIYAGFERIAAATTTAHERFKASKCYREQLVGPEEPEEAPEEAAEADPEPAAQIVPVVGITPRQAEMLRIWDEASHEQGALIEMLAMQREVIAGLQADIDRLKQS